MSYVILFLRPSWRFTTTRPEELHGSFFLFSSSLSYPGTTNYVSTIKFSIYVLHLWIDSNVFIYLLACLWVSGSY